MRVRIGGKKQVEAPSFEYSKDILEQLEESLRDHKFRCESCGKVFSYRQTLKVKTWMNKLIWKCPFCFVGKAVEISSPLLEKEKE